MVCTIDGGWAAIRVGMGWIGLSSLLRTRICQCIVRNIDNLCVEMFWFIDIVRLHQIGSRVYRTTCR